MSASPSPEEYVAGLLPKLRSPTITYFPIRHHSPVCAIHIRRWIETHKPSAVLIEGPSAFDPLIDLLLDERCVCPVALFTLFVDKKNRLGPADLFGPPRFAAYYPFCDYSPELVALRTGKEVGARLRFIDLDYPEMILSKYHKPEEKISETVRIDSLSGDDLVSHSTYVQMLAERLRCRDVNEVWDHLFESQFDSTDTNALIDQIAAYCAMARLSYHPQQLEVDGTTQREACMAAAIQEELERSKRGKNKGPILVVTGGFHTVVLLDLVSNKVQRPNRPDLVEEETGTWLMRYSFDQLDMLAGYASGMPQPSFYDRLWQMTAHVSESEKRLDARLNTLTDLAVEVSRLSRQRGFHPTVTTPDAIAAIRMSRELAHLRGHDWPLREDLLDGMRSCFIKGEMHTDGVPLQKLILEVLGGRQVGQVPPGTGTPPIVSDFHQECRRLKLPIDQVERKEVILDLYRDPRHRDISRLLHRLDLLGSSYGRYLNGPDFVRGTGLDRIQEYWEVMWSPSAESSLIEAAVYGETLEYAAANKLQAEVAKLLQEGQGRNTAEAVNWLIRSCRLGLHRQSLMLLEQIQQFAGEDPSFLSVVNGLSQLELLARSREPLQAGELPSLPILIQMTYQRACYLLGDLANVPDELVHSSLDHLRILREVVVSAVNEDHESPFDRQLFLQGLERVTATPADKAQAVILGGTIGLLHAEGKRSEEELITITQGFLGGAAQTPQRAAGFLRGLLTTSGELAWQVSGILHALDRQFRTWDDDSFLTALPELRLAFADLTPKQIAQVADAVSDLHGEKLDNLVQTDLTEADLMLALIITNRVRESLHKDHLK